MLKEFNSIYHSDAKNNQSHHPTSPIQYRCVESFGTLQHNVESHAQYYFISTLALALRDSGVKVSRPALVSAS